MPYEIQSKMLRLLQEREYTPVGASNLRKAKCRFLFATNRDLEILSKEGKFRQDLYYRINVFQFSLPSLRERKEDIPALAGVFVNTYAPEFASGVTGIDPDAISALCAYDFPGNIRELQNIILRAVAVAEGNLLTLKDLNLPTVQSQQSVMSPQFVNVVDQILPGKFQDMMADHAKRIISDALKQARGNRSRAAELLDMHRSSLDYRMKELKIDARDFIEATQDA